MKVDIARIPYDRIAGPCLWTSEFVESLLLDAHVDFTVDDNLRNSAGCYLPAKINGVSVLFIGLLEKDDPQPDAFKRAMEQFDADIAFHCWPSEESLCKVPNLHPLGPISYGARNQPWEQYRWSLFSVDYAPAGDLVLLYNGPSQKPYRKAAIQAIEKSKYVAVYQYKHPRECLYRVNNCWCAVGAPGISPFMVDTMVIQYMSLGCCVVCPEIRCPLPGSKLVAGEHYLKCRDDYSDVLQVLDQDAGLMKRIGDNAKKFFKKNLTPIPLLRYVRSIVREKLSTYERLMIGRSELEAAKQTARSLRHVERYRLARNYAAGAVLDFGCGCGFGSEIILQSPQVMQYVGFDVDKAATKYARWNYSERKVSFVDSVTEFDKDAFDTVLAIEVLEHLDSLDEFMRLIEKLGPKRVVVTFPSSATKHIDPFHISDLTVDEVVDHFSVIGYETALNKDCEDSKFLLFEKKEE